MEEQYEKDIEGVYARKPETPDDIVAGIRLYIREHSLDKNVMWDNREFLDFYYGEKLKMAKLLLAVLEEFGQDFHVRKVSSNRLRIIDNSAVRIALKKIEAEEKKLRDAFKAVQHLPKAKADQQLIADLKLEEVFKDAHPCFCRVRNLLIAVLNESDYGKVEGNDSAGTFSDEDGQIPIVKIKADDEYMEINFKNLYRELIDNVARHLLFKRGKTTNVPNIDGALEEINEEMPFESWYATHVLGLGDRHDLHYLTTIFDTIPDHKQYDYVSQRKYVQRTVMHEFQHAVCRFLPVSPADLPEGNFSAADTLRNWLGRFAEEVVLYSFAGRTASIKYYLEAYDSEIEFDPEEDRTFVVENFKEEAKCFREINSRIVKSRRRKLISTLFSLEKPCNWKSVHEYLMSDGLPELGYYKGPLNKK